MPIDELSGGKVEVSAWRIDSYGNRRRTSQVYGILIYLVSEKSGHDSSVRPSDRLQESARTS